MTEDKRDKEEVMDKDKHDEDVDRNTFLTNLDKVISYTPSSDKVEQPEKGRKKTLE